MVALGQKYQSQVSLLVQKIPKSIVPVGGVFLRIKLNLQIFIFLIIFYFTNQIDIYVTLILFALIHEVAHIVVGITYGLKPKTLKITPFGISIYFEKYKRNGKKILEKQKIIIALAGPIINIAIAVGIMFLPSNIFIHISQENLILANLLLALFNLIPIYPLDGGRIINSILSLKKIDKKNNIILTEKISYICLIILTLIASLVILILQNIAIFFIIIYLWLLVLQQIKYNRLRLRVFEMLKVNSE